MFWQEDDSEKEFQIPDDVVDLRFAIDCRRIPVDHAYALSQALRSTLPWIEGETGVAVHTVHVAGSQNGWERPGHAAENQLMVSKRTKLTIRTPKHLVEPLLNELRGKTLDIGGFPLTVGAGATRPLSAESTLFARHVVANAGGTEEEFLRWATAELGRLGLRVRKAVCGKAVELSTPAGPVYTRSLMVAGLSPEESVRLQQVGLGPRRDMGCGIFIPHKGIDSVKRGG